MKTIMRILFLLNAAHAVAEEIHFTSFNSYTAVSGTESSGQTSLPQTVELDMPFKEINSILMREKGDEPCFISASNHSDSSFEWDECNGYPASIYIGGQGAFLRGVNVCYNDKSGLRGQIIKGLETDWIGAPYFRNGQDPRTMVTKRTNCKNWQNKVSCPAGSAVGSIIVHHKLVDNRRAAVGIQLACYNTVNVTQSAFEPVWRRGTASWREISGSGQGDREIKYSLTNEPHGENYLIKGISVKEHFDEPSKVTIHVQHQYDSDYDFNGLIDLKARGDVLEGFLGFLYPANNTEGARRNGLGAGQYNDSNSEFSVVNSDLDEHLGALGVCTSNSGKVKGVRVNMRSLTESGAIDANFMESDTLRHCRNWLANSTCANDEAIIGFKLNYNRQKGLTAVGVQCAKLSSVPQAPIPSLRPPMQGGVIIRRN